MTSTTSVDRRPDAQPRAEADHERVVVVDQLRGQRVGVVHPDRLDVERRAVAELARQHARRAPASSCPEVVGAVDRGDDVEAEREASRCVDQLVLAEELDRLVRGAMDADLRAAEQPEARTRGRSARRSRGRTNPRARSPKSPCAERPPEAVGDAERALVPRQPQRGRQVTSVKSGCARFESRSGSSSCAGARRWRRRAWRGQRRRLRESGSARQARIAPAIMTAVSASRDVLVDRF